MRRLSRPAGGGYDASLLRKAAGAAALARRDSAYGHLAVQIDPLGTPPPGAAELKPEFHGITEPISREVPASALGDDERGTAADVMQRMRDLYCGALGVRVRARRATKPSGSGSARRSSPAKRRTPLTADEKKALLERLTEVDGLERFLGRAYVSVKRFSIEGVDALVPMLDEAIARGADAGARQVVIGMAHRGRLNVLTHVMGKPYRALLEEFEGHHPSTRTPRATRAT